MADTTTSTNMLLPVPIVGQDPGPTYATDINSCLSLIDQHDHSPNHGVPITPSGLNISSDLSILGNNLTTVKGVRFSTQTPATPSSSPNVDTLYVSGHDLYYNNSAGNQVQITIGPVVAGSPGNIANLIAPATASFDAIGGKFVWMRTGTAYAQMEFSDAVMHNPDTFANALTLKSPASPAAPFSIILPYLPASNSFLQMDTSGVITGVIPLSLGIVAANIANATITDAKMVANTLTASSIANATLTGTQMSSNINLPGNAVKENGQNVVVSNTNASTSLSIIRGYINSAAAVVFGEGIATVSQPSLGTYVITFTTPFASAPACTAMAVTAGAGTPDFFFAIPPTNTSQLVIANNSGLSRDFMFIAIGPR